MGDQNEFIPVNEVNEDNQPSETIQISLPWSLDGTRAGIRPMFVSGLRIVDILHLQNRGTERDLIYQSPHFMSMYEMTIESRKKLGRPAINRLVEITDNVFEINDDIDDFEVDMKICIYT
jgi:hypothetical protein